MVTINKNSNRPYYEQLVIGIKEDILHGILEPGEKVPSVREMAKQLLMNPNTVGKAYKVLESEQVLVTVKGKGTFVKKQANIPRDEERIHDLHQQFHILVIEAKHLQVTDEELQEWLKQAKKRFRRFTIMKVSHLTKTIDQKLILEDITFELTSNELVGLIGRNGSGKTTLFRTIAGHYYTDGGEITIDDKNIETMPKERQHIFYIDEKENFLSQYSLKKINAFYRAAYPNFDQDLFVSLMHEHELPLRLSYNRMSKGMQGLFQMILAVCSNATYLLLDEPFDGLDVIVRKKVIGLLLENMSETKRTTLIASHNLDELEKRFFAIAVQFVNQKRVCLAQFFQIIVWYDKE